MLSILIPVYNYNIFQLVVELHKQCMACEIEFEIVCLDDASTHYSTENQKINSFSNCQYLINTKNLGRTSTRNKLTNNATYDWLLFLDADVIPVSSNFIKNYITHINSKPKVIIGGYCYQNTLPEFEQNFRYKYGKNREEKSALERNSNPYKYIFSGNLLILKKKFIETSFTEEAKYYGMDIYFSYQLYIKKIEVLHIENPIYHLGLETNQIFFEKSLKAVESRKQFLINCPEIKKISPLIKKYKTIKQYHLLPTAILFFKIFEPYLKRRILSKKPNLFCFDIYRLGYICTLK
ncbi:glycosyltransferase [Flavobacterium sp.]|uniref:glycosyltransferase family 2 protein n=1 Tax=Flavobacterium sp. TaxID=239 RepID=UPI0032638259